MLDPVKNFAKVTVSTGYDSTATSIDLVTGDGAKLPDPATEGAFNLVWWNATDYPDPADDPNVEIVRVTAKSGDTLTITRGQEGTSAQNHNTAGKAYKMILAPTKKMIDDIGNSLVSALNDLGDVSISTPSAGQYFRYDGANWVNSAIQAADLPSHTHVKADITDTPWAWTDVDKTGSSINDLGDVAITSPSAGHYLRYDGSNWVNSSLQAADLPSHTHSGADITSGLVGAAYGGTGLDTSASTGIPKISSGTWSVGANLNDLGDVSISSPSDGQVLTYNSTSGKWENQTPSGGGSFVGCKVTRTTNQSINSATLTTVNWDDEEFDTDGFHDNSTNNSRITIPTGKAGYYRVYAHIDWYNSGGLGAAGTKYVRLAKNGAAVGSTFNCDLADGRAYTFVLNTILYLNEGDYLEIMVYNANSSFNVTYPSSFFGVEKIG